MNQEIKERAQKIKAVLTDIDGIWTDGKINFFVRDDGKVDEFKCFNALDGIAGMLGYSCGLTLGVITGRRHEVTVHRAQTLGVKYLYQGFLSKLGPLDDILQKEGLKPEEVAYIGDDLTDIPLLEKVGLAATVPNAVDAVKKAAHLVTSRKGGEGAFRELIDTVLDAQGKLEPVLNQIRQEKWDRSHKPRLQVVTSQEGIS